MIKQYVQYFYPGIFFAEDSYEEINATREEFLAMKPKFPKGCFAFRFFTKEVIEGETGKLVGEPFNYSGMYYNGGQVYTTAELEELYPNETILIANSRSRGTVVRTSQGNWQDFNPKADTVLY